MKALSLWNPYAHLVAIRAKRFETRSWATSYRGPLAIHASKRWDLGLRFLIRRPPFNKYCTDPVYPGGCIVAVADLVDVIEASLVAATLHEAWLNGSDASREEMEFGDYTPGRFAWQLENLRRLPSPIPTRGFQGFWNLTDDVVSLINSQLSIPEAS